MRIINRKNAIPVLCCTYTLISLTNAVLELVSHQVNMNEGLNSLTILIVSAAAIFVLTLESRLRRWNLLLVILLQYVVFIGCVMSGLWLLHFMITVHPNGYQDMFFSCTFLFMIGAVVYYIAFFVEVWKKNQMLAKIQSMENQIK